MAIAIRSITTNTNSGSSTTIAVTTSESPSATQVGDLVIVVHANDYFTLADMPTPTATGSPTLTSIVNADAGSLTAHIKTWYYYANTAGAQTVSVTESGLADEEKSLAVYVLSGAAASSPIDGTPASNVNASAVTSQVCNAVTTTNADSYVITAIGSGGGAASSAYAPPGDITEQYDIRVGGGSWCGGIKQLSASGSTGTFTWTATGASPYAAVTFAIKTASAAVAVPFNPQRTVQTRDPGESWWVQKDRRDANLVATAANNLAPPLLAAEPSPGVYRDRRVAAQQRRYFDPSLLTPAAAMPAPSPQRVVQTRDPGEVWFLQSPRRDPSLLTTALLENELLGAAETRKRTNAPATHADRREVPQQRPYISDPSFYPTVAPVDPLTVAWGAGGNYWHLYNDVRVERRIVPQQRAYVSGPSLLPTALLEVPYVRLAQLFTDRRMTAGPARTFDLTLLDAAGPPTLGDLLRRYLTPATNSDRRVVPQQPLRQALYFDAGPDVPPLTLAWGAGGNLWHLYNDWSRPRTRWPQRAVFGVIEHNCDTDRPGSGSIARPGGLTLRPDSGLTDNPC